jgi:lysophospholipase L1-like esterase
MTQRLRNTLFLFLIIFIFYACERANHENTPVRIMPLGNSITQADTRHSGYRYPLWTLLKEGGYNIDFVGSLKMNHGGENPVQAFDTDHEGHWGWRADQILNGVTGKGNLKHFLDASTPDIVLLHLGSNDIFQGESVDEVIADLTRIIGILKSANREIIILIAQILPVANIHINRQIKMLNMAISRLPSEVKHSSGQIIIVNQNEGFNPYADAYDGIHPNTSGEYKMAQKWYESLKRVLKKRNS